MPPDSLLAAHPARFVTEFIAELVRDSAENRLSQLDGAPIFEGPVVGVASGDAPLFRSFKEGIGSFHHTPREVLGEYARLARRPQGHDTASVISWALPMAPGVVKTMRGARDLPSRHWAHAHAYGAAFNNIVRARLVRCLLDRGYATVAPLQMPSYEVYAGGPGGRAANWSEKHVAYAAGLGTFGLNSGLITQRGVAVYLGSVVTTLPLPETGRSYATPTAHCPFYTNRGCTECISRCPGAAIGEQGLDKEKCMQYVRQSVFPLREVYGLEAVGCALCFTGVPCERGIPSQA